MKRFLILAFVFIAGCSTTTGSGSGGSVWGTVQSALGGPKEYGVCALMGTAIGAGAGSIGSGVLIADNPRSFGSAGDTALVTAGIVVGSAIVLGVISHYACDPASTPAPTQLLPSGIIQGAPNKT